MTDKASAAGWVVEVAQPAKGIEPAKTTYFDVAIKNAVEAAEAATRKAGFVGAGPARAVRSLSSDDIEFIGLKAGQVRPS